MTPNFEDAIATIAKAWEGRKDAPDYPDYDDINTSIGSLEKAVKTLGILKEYADKSVERTEFIDGKEYKYTAIVIEIPNDGGIDYEAIKEWLKEDKDRITRGKTLMTCGNALLHDLKEAKE